MISRRSGTTVAEAAVALMLGTLVLSLVIRTLLHAAETSRVAIIRDDVLLSTRVARVVLRSELMTTRPQDVRSEGGDSVRLRAIRGAGRVCSIESDSAVVVDLQSSRRPEPTKDSIELIGSLGQTEVVGLRAATPVVGLCGPKPKGVPMVLVVDGRAGRGAIYARLFETGSYHLHGGALRYRAGRGGRQPLTPDVWTANSALQLDGAWVRLTLSTVGTTPDSTTILVSRR